MVELQRREWRSIEHQFAARGALGGALTAALRDAAERGVEEIGNEFVGTILPRIVE